jgi:hypothetical protein
MILHYSMTGFLDTAQQAVSHEIHLSRLIRAVRPVHVANTSCIMPINIP